MSDAYKFRGTPGPWLSEDATVYSLQMCSTHDGNGVPILENRLYAHVYVNHNKEEDVANAQAMAAVPDMIEALIAARGQLLLLHPRGTDEVHDAVVGAIEAALDKALK